MKQSLLNDALFRRAFIVSAVIGILARFIVLRITDKQYPSRPQDYLEQIIMSGLAASLGAIAFPALIDKEFSALTFFAVAIQQFQGVASQERITLKNIDENELVPKGAAYIEEIASTYEVRSYISLFSSLGASVIYIFLARRYKLEAIWCALAAAIIGIIIGLIFRRYLRRNSLGDIADVVEAKITFEESALLVNEVFINNIGLEATRKRYIEDGLAVEIIPKNMGDFGVISDVGQREAILHNIYLHLGINKDVDEVDIIATSKTDLNKNTIVIPFIPILKDIELMKEVIKSTPIIEASKNKQSAYKRKAS